MENRIKKMVLDLGADLCGIANIDRFVEAPAGFHPTDIYKDCKSVVVFAKSLPAGLYEVSPRLAYNRANNMVLETLDSISINASRMIEEWGGTAVPIPCDCPYDYWDGEKMEGRGMLSMRHAASLAGIGRMGNNLLILTKKYGNRINIGALLTNLDLTSDPFAEDLCLKGCNLCVESCPQKAIQNKTIIQKLCREYTYSNNARGFSVVDCNNCRTVCPMALGSEGKKSHL